MDDIPIQRLSVGDLPALEIEQGNKKSKRDRRRDKKSRRRRSGRFSSDEEVVDKGYSVMAVEELPAGAELEEGEDATRKPKDGLDMDLDTPLGDFDLLVVSY